MTQTRFKTKANLGSFGEFCYQAYALRNGLDAKKAGILEYDFLVSDRYFVDVKTTEKKLTRYMGRRIRDDIVYDLITVVDNKVTIYPDLLSPLFQFGPCQIGIADELIAQWSASRKIKKINIQASNSVRINRNIIKAKISRLFDGAKYTKIRYVFRGSVSNTRWSASPDNLPGPASQILKYDCTIFIQMVTKNQEEIIQKVFVIDHNNLGSMKMKQADNRQRRKGIQEVLDLGAFELNQKDHVLSNLEELQVYIDKYLSN